MTEENKLRLRQLGWGNKKPVSHNDLSMVNRAEKRAARAEVRMLKLEKELIDTLGWLDRLADRYRDRGYDSSAIDRKVRRIKEALKP